MTTETTQMTDSTPEVSAASKTVLLIDDDQNLLGGLQRVLRRNKFRILTAVSAPEGRAILAREDVDLILCDNLMAGTLGTDFLAEVHTTHPDIALIMLSGYMPDAVAQKMMADCGVSQVLLKPCDPDTVQAAISQALGLLPTS